MQNMEEKGEIVTVTKTEISDFWERETEGGLREESEYKTTNHCYPLGVKEGPKNV